MRFRDLKIGDRFDFIGPDRMLNSFHRRVEKVGPRSYMDVDGGARYRIGTINADVYHVTAKAAP